MNHLWSEVKSFWGFTPPPPSFEEVVRHALYEASCFLLKAEESLEEATIRREVMFRRVARLNLTRHNLENPCIPTLSDSLSPPFPSLQQQVAQFPTSKDSLKPPTSSVESLMGPRS